MPTQNKNANDAPHAGLSKGKREKREFDAKFSALRAAIDEGDASGITASDVFPRVRKSLKLPVRKRQ